MSYSKKLQDPRWQKKRFAILKRDSWKCKLCDDTETMLQVHHKEYTEKEPWNEPNKNLVTLCKHCHEEISMEKFKGADISKIRVHKSCNWVGGSIIMFIAYEDSITMRIYDDNEEFIVGFNISDDLPEIKKLINYTLRYE